MERLKKRLKGYNKSLCDYYDSESKIEMDQRGNIVFEESDSNNPNKEVSIGQQNEQLDDGYLED